jgi:hypothetical protein
MTGGDESSLIGSKIKRLTNSNLIYMKKLLLLFSLVVCMCLSLYSQDTRRGWIGITAGTAIPLGDFASKDGDGAGFAKTGLNINLINFGYKFGKNFGITAAWYGAAHSIDLDGVSGTWSYGGLMAGPLLSFPVSENVDFDLKPMFGFATAKLDLEVYEESGASLTFDLGASIRYGFAEKWGLLINMDYLSANPKFDDGNQKISALNLSLGLAYRIK